MKMLLAAGADVNIRDDEGKTAMDYAENEKFKEIVRELFRAVMAAHAEQARKYEEVNSPVIDGK